MFMKTAEPAYLSRNSQSSESLVLNFVPPDCSAVLLCRRDCVTI